MDQKSDEWLAWRRAGIGSSDAAAIMGVSPYQTAFQLWEIKTGRRTEQMSSFVMERGNDLEPIARARYEIEHDMDMPPQLCQHETMPHLRASLDGANFEARGGLEIKFLGENDFKLVGEGVVPHRYFPQIMHQFLVTGFEWIDLYGYNAPKDAENHNGKSVVLRVKPDLPYIAEKLFPAEQAFWRMVETKTPPPFVDADYKSIRVKGAKALAAEYVAKVRAGTEPQDTLEALLAMVGTEERARIYNLRFEMANGTRIIKIVDGGKDGMQDGG